MTLRWEGWCNRDDNLTTYLEIFPRVGTAAPSSCHEYEVAFAYSGALPSDDRCGESYLSW